MKRTTIRGVLSTRTSRFVDKLRWASKQFKRGDAAVIMNVRTCRILNLLRSSCSSGGRLRKTFYEPSPAQRTLLRRFNFRNFFYFIINKLAQRSVSVRQRLPGWSIGRLPPATINSMQGAHRFMRGCSSGPHQIDRGPSRKGPRYAGEAKSYPFEIGILPIRTLLKAITLDWRAGLDTGVRPAFSLGFRSVLLGCHSPDSEPTTMLMFGFCSSCWGDQRIHRLLTL